MGWKAWWTDSVGRSELTEGTAGEVLLDMLRPEGGPESLAILERVSGRHPVLAAFHLPAGQSFLPSGCVARCGSLCHAGWWARRRWRTGAAGGKALTQGPGSPLAARALVRPALAADTVSGVEALWVNRSVPQVRLHFLHELNDLPGGVEVADRFGYAECQPVAHVLEDDPHRLVGYPVVEGRAVGRGVVRNPYCLHRPARLGGECAELFLGDLLGPSHGAYVVRHVLRRQVLAAAHSISPFH